MRTFCTVIVVVGLSAAHAGQAAANPCRTVTPVIRAAPPGESIVVASFFERELSQLLESSATLRSQYDRITSTSRVRVRVEPWPWKSADWMARATITRSASGMLDAHVQIPTPLRAFEYAEMLAHEFEHILEQIEGVDLAVLAADPGHGVSRTVGGAFETTRAQRAGQAAAKEVAQAARDR